MKTFLPALTSLTIVFLNVVAGAQAPRPAESARTVPAQVQVEAKFFTIPMDAAARLGLTPLDDGSSPARGGRLRRAAYEKLLADLAAENSVKEISAPQVTTKSGQRAVIEVIREFRFPTEFELVNGDQIAPKTFETRNVGVTLEVAPVVTDGEFIDLHIRPGVTAFHRFAHYAGGKTRAAGPMPRDGFAQPIFDFTRCSVATTLRSGQGLLLGGYEWHGSDDVMQLPGLMTEKPEVGPAKERRLLFIALTAKLMIPPVDPTAAKAGSPVTVTTQLATLTRDRLPQWIGLRDIAGGTAATRTLGTPGFHFGCVFIAEQAGQLRKMLETASGGPLSSGPVKKIAAPERYFAEVRGWQRYLAGTTADVATGQPKAEDARVERVDLQLAIAARSMGDNSIDLEITPNSATSEKAGPDASRDVGSGGTVPEWKLLDEEPRWTKKTATTALTLWSGMTALFVKASEERPDLLHVLLIRVSTNKDEGAAAVATPQSAQKWPWAIPVEGKSGYVVSPYAEYKGYIDVRGFPRGTEVRCPYSGKSFLVP